MPGNYWCTDSLRHAARLLVDAANNLHTAYPHHATKPCPRTLPAVEAMIHAALECVRHAQPEPPKEPSCDD